MEPNALVVGESLVDVMDGVDHPGGSAANVAVALARLGRPVRFLTAYADDDRGAAIAAHLAASGVVLAADPQVLGRTSAAIATLAADGSATYEFDIEWRLPALAEPAPLFAHVCSIGAVLPPGADDVLALVRALPAACTTTYDVNARPSITGTGPDLVARVEAMARCVDVVKASDEDLAALYPLLSVEAAADHLLGLGRPRAVVVTRGADGLTWFGGGGTAPVHVPAAPSVVVDTIGAGDTVSAALVDALWSGLGPSAALHHAARAAAVTVSRPGADPPTRADLTIP